MRTVQRYDLRNQKSEEMAELNEGRAGTGSLYWIGVLMVFGGTSNGK